MPYTHMKAMCIQKVVIRHIHATRCCKKESYSTPGQNQHNRDIEKTNTCATMRCCHPNHPNMSQQRATHHTMLSCSHPKCKGSPHASQKAQGTTSVWRKECRLPIPNPCPCKMVKCHHVSAIQHHAMLHTYARSYRK